MKIEIFLQAAKEAALIGGQVLKKNFRKIESRNIHEKAEKDVVSYVDKASEERITDYLFRRFPQHKIIGEESGGTDEGEFVWYIDPLDGTKNYITGFPIFGVSVSLLHMGKPLVGAVYVPLFDDLYWAGKRIGAYKNKNSIRVGTTTKSGYSVIAYGFASKPKRDIEVYLHIYKEILTKVAAIRNPGAAAVELCFLAEGVFEGLVEFEVEPWDINAGILILQEAGGIYSVLEHNEKRDIIASNGRLQKLLEKIVFQYIK